MVKVCFKKGNYGYEECHIDGHAEYNGGNDIVCSAVSALGFALIGALKNLAGVSFRELQAEKGIDVVINPFSKESLRLLTETIFMTIYIGLKQVEKAYPDNVKIHEERV